MPITLILKRFGQTVSTEIKKELSVCWIKMASRCPRCEKAVYFAEEVKQSGYSWHRSCFRCMKCNTSLDSNNFTEHGGSEIYCKGCHGKKFGTGGYGYGQGAGVLQTDRGGPAGTMVEETS